MSRTEIKYTATATLPTAEDLDELSVVRGVDSQTGKEVEPTVWVATIAWKWLDKKGKPTSILRQESAKVTLPLEQKGRPTDAEALTALYEVLRKEGWIRKPATRTKPKAKKAKKKK